MKYLLLTASFLLISFPTLHAKTFNSGKKQVRLIELYTSQSCSSCPPAEAWVSNLKTNKNTSNKLWTDFIPLSYHVAYWDHLSWKDRFSKQKYSKRQRDYNQVIKGGVYTPQVVLDGKDFRKWRSNNTSYLKSTVTPGNLKASISKDLKSAQLHFSKKETNKDLICQGAYIENGHFVKITSGENSGRKLKQDFVVIDIFKKVMEKNKNGYSCSLNLTFDQKRIAKEKGLVFWVVDKKSYQVIQATGGLL